MTGLLYLLVEQFKGRFIRVSKEEFERVQNMPPVPFLGLDGREYLTRN